MRAEEPLLHSEVRPPCSCVPEMKRDSPKVSGIAGVTYRITQAEITPPAQSGGQDPGARDTRAKPWLCTPTFMEGQGDKLIPARIPGLEPPHCLAAVLLSLDPSWLVLSLSPKEPKAGAPSIAGDASPMVNKPGPDNPFVFSVIFPWNQPLSHLSADAKDKAHIGHWHLWPRLPGSAVALPHQPPDCPIRRHRALQVPRQWCDRTAL